MSPTSDLLEASTELLQNLRHFVQAERPEDMWQELLAWLVMRTQARGGRLVFANPALPTLVAGAIDETSLAWFTDQQQFSPHRLASPEVHTLSSGRLLELVIAAENGYPLLNILLDYSEDQAIALLPEYCTLLATALQAVATAAAGRSGLRETQDRLNRFRHLYEVGQVITSSLDLDQVLRLSTARVAEVLRAEASTLLLVDDVRRELVFKIPAGPAEQILLEKRMSLDKGVAGWAATHGEPVIIGDVETDTRFYNDIDRQTGYRTHSIMAVPMQVKGRIIGVVEVINKIGGGAFTADDLQWLSILAPLIAIAIDNARLFTDERQRVSELRAANTVATALNQTLELAVMLRSALVTTMGVLHAEAGEIGLRNAETSEIEFSIQEGTGMVTGPGNAALAHWIVDNARPLILPEVAADPRAKRLHADAGHIHSYAGVPLIARDRVIGVLSVMSTHPDAFDASQLALLDTIGRQAGMAVENARLYVALREERDRIIAAEEKVRHELARNLHDGPAQIMAAMILNIDMARRQLAAKPEKMATELNFLESLAQEANQEVRDLLFNMRPVSLEAHGLVAALTQLVDRQQPHANYQLHLEVQPLPAQPIDPRVAGTLFVIVQEALNNIQKHAGAQNVWIRLGTTAQDLTVEVADDGAGFDVNTIDASYAQRNSFGLLNMRERARLIEGETRIVSPRTDDNPGTAVLVNVPLSRACPVPA
jgi:signal transduction histidine kinase